ncbi:hypothetical protein PDJAM_G00146530 [Pangasius djambal]|uniref:Uncharacterized protein n=1 Tax=Pangasius djambal TaxID=1691987 RepID=A0ACC5ZHT0_9TELE|nr:hypothetical protein [Pangasius djambal]
MEIDETSVVISINPNNFPGKLWRLVNDPQICSICWDASGEGILIHQQPFEAEVLLSHTRQMNDYFKTTDFTSFIRQLNLYGFRKVRPDHDISEKQLDSSSVMAQPHHFHNPNFKRDKPELLVNLKRLTPVNKAKLAAGIELTSRSSKRFPHAMLNSPQENSAVMKKGSAVVGHQGTPYHHHCNGPQQVKECDRTPKPSQAFVVGHGDPSPVTLYTNKVVPVSVFHHFPMDSPCAHPSSPAHVQQGIMPHHSQYRFYTPVYQCCSPGFLDSKVPCSQQPAASYSHCGYYPDYSVGYLHPNDQDPDWKAGDVPDSRKSDMRVNLDTVFKVADEMQAAADVREVAEATSHLGRQLE